MLPPKTPYNVQAVPGGFQVYNNGMPASNQVHKDFNTTMNIAQGQSISNGFGGPVSGQTNLNMFTK